MNYSDATPEEKLDIDRRILMGKGELVEYNITVLEEQTVVEEPAKEGGKAQKVKKMVPVEKVKLFYIGKMSLKVTSGVISIVSNIVANGNELKNVTGRTDNMAFIEYLDEYHLSVLLHLITSAPREWFLGEDFDVEQVLNVLDVFLKYNNFFALVMRATSLGETLGLSAEKVKGFVTGA